MWTETQPYIKSIFNLIWWYCSGWKKIQQVITQRRKKSHCQDSDWYIVLGPAPGKNLHYLTVVRCVFFMLSRKMPCRKIFLVEESFNTRRTKIRNDFSDIVTKILNLFGWIWWRYFVSIRNLYIHSGFFQYPLIKIRGPTVKQWNWVW